MLYSLLVCPCFSFRVLNQVAKKLSYQLLPDYFKFRSRNIRQGLFFASLDDERGTFSVQFP